MDIKELIEKAFAVGHTIGYGNTENHYKPEFERWWNDENTQEQVKNCSIPDVVGRSEQLKCDCCDGTGLVEGEHYDDLQGCLTCNGRGTF